jgi:hypothetical protein
MRKLANHTALKEWSNVVAALGRGDQVILIRKGGIADVSFALEASQFYLYPTYFHQGESEARPVVEISHWCEVVDSWSVRDVAMLASLENEVVLPRETLDARYRFRPDQALFVFGVRTWKLATPQNVAFREEYAGCRSWISTEEEIDVDGSTPVLQADELNARIQRVVQSSSRRVVQQLG